MTLTHTFSAPLCTSWREQNVRLLVQSLRSGQAVTLSVDGETHPFQYTGVESEAGAEIMLRLGFEKGQRKTLTFTPAEIATTDFTPIEIDASRGAVLGVPGAELRVPELTCENNCINGPLTGFANFPLQSRIVCDAPLVSRQVTQTNSGTLYDEYEVAYCFEQNRTYKILLRCSKDEPLVEVSEEFSLGMNARLEIVFNPCGCFDSTLSHGPFDFEGDGQPTIEKLNQTRPNDLLCRLQMPTLSEYAIPNNRGWFSFFDSRDEVSRMLGVLGLYGALWKQPVENMMRVYDCNGQAELRASLCGGQRYWLLYAGAQEKQFTSEKPFVFHRLHAEWNALRLDEHLDLTGEAIHDASCWQDPGFFEENYREKARCNTERLAPLRKLHPDDFPTLRVLLNPQPHDQKLLYEKMRARLQKWVRQFQGFREDKNDYGKNVIGFSRMLRGLLLDYELLRKDEYLNDEQLAQLHSYFVFAARRILDEGRWPHSRTWLHPDHPESVRDLYTYPGEHRPDRLVWTNSLPNFQSDPMCALLHLSTLIPEHPDAQDWQRFALDDLERQLDAYCSESGAWEESINYALYSLSYFIITFRTLKNRTGINYFEDERMRRFAGWLTRFFGPLDKRFNAYTFPGIGNSRVPQNEGHILLAYAGELEEGDPLRDDLIACYQKMEPDITPAEHSPLLLAAMAPVPDKEYSLRSLQSEHMQGLGVAMRHAHPSPNESYLFQKIGLWKDHYENDESSFNWYAKGTPLVMDYGTYTPDVSTAAAHSLVEIPDMDSLRRGYLADKYFSPLLDYTRCEMPVNLKLLHGRVRSFKEIDGPLQPPQYFYIGDQNPVGPKTWKTRMLLFVKPDYLVLFDRVFGPVSHRFNLHVTADELVRDGNFIQATGRFDLDMKCFVQQPAVFEFEQGVLSPGGASLGEHPQEQHFFRLYNSHDGIYRTLLFAQEQGRDVSIEKFGACGIRVSTPEYTDIVFLSNEVIHEKSDGVEFVGRAGWIRRDSSGEVMACVLNGNVIAAFSQRITGRGPWAYNMDGKAGSLIEGPPRGIRIEST